MTQEEKQLLFKDLCARLPYSVVVHCTDSDTDDYNCFLTTDILHEIQIGYEYYDYKPYLRPLSSMTAEEKEELEKNYVLSSLNFVVYKIHQHKEWYGGDDEECTFDDYLWLIDWLNAHHFDYRGLIPMGLALEAHEGMYKQ